MALITNHAADTECNYWQRGGCRWGESLDYGSWNVTWPLTRLQLSDQFVRISIAIGPTFEFCAKEVVLRRVFHLWWGVQFTHTKPEYPPLIAFWSFNRSELLLRAQRAGFTVETR